MSKQKKVLITDGVHPVMFEGLEELGFNYDYMPKISLEEVHQIIGDYEGLIVNSKIIAKKELFDKAEKLFFIARLGSGMEIIDQEYAKKKGIHVINSPEGNRNAVAEHALGLLLSLANKFIIADKEVRTKHWNREKNRGFEIQGKTIGLIGFGHTGGTFGKKLAGLEMNVLAYDKYKKDYTHHFPYIQESTLEDIQKKADIISFHLPLNEKTHHIANKVFFDNCKKGMILINTARGSLVHTLDLIEALDSGQVGGACLDVFENEKPDTFSYDEHRMYDDLYRFENVILSPHIAGWTQESKYKLSKVILDKLGKVLTVD
jgi:D-3-phosphoglycerate dehydrogenase